MSKKFFYNTLAILFVILFLSAIIAYANPALPLLLRQIVTSTASKAAYHRAAIETAKATKIAKDARAVATINTGRVVGSNGQIVRFAFQTGITGASIAAIAAIAAQRLGYQQRNVDDNGNVSDNTEGFCSIGNLTTIDSSNLGVVQRCLDDYVDTSLTCTSANVPGGCYCNWDAEIGRWSVGSVSISRFTSMVLYKTSPERCWYGYERIAIVSELEMVPTDFNPLLPSKYFDLYGNQLSTYDAERIASESLNIPWPDHADPLIQNVLTMPTENEINQSFQNLKNNLASDVEQVEIAQETSVIQAIGQPDGSGLTSVYFKSDLDGRTFEQKVADAIAESMRQTIADANTEGQFDEAVADTLPIEEEIIQKVTHDPIAGTTTTTTTTIRTDPITGTSTATTTTTVTDGETTTTTEETEETLPDIDGPTFPPIPPFDTTIDVPEKDPIPMQAWRDMIPFMDVLEGTKVEATGGVCLLTITTNQFGSWDLDFCSWDTHLQWLGNFIYIFACFIGLRMVLTGRE